MKLKKGDKVSVLDENLIGTVKSIKDDLVIIESDDGFDMEFLVSELIKIESKTHLRDEAFINISASDVVKEKNQNTKKKEPKIKLKQRQQPPLEVDLHIDKLIDSVKGMTNYDMLNLQLDTAKRQLEFAIRKRIQRVVFIHGVGEGVLKMELESLLRRYDNVKYYEANLKKYGYGATEVYIYQNV